MTMSDGFKALIKEVEKLTAAITRGSSARLKTCRPLRWSATWTGATPGARARELTRRAPKDFATSAPARPSCCTAGKRSCRVTKPMPRSARAAAWRCLAAAAATTSIVINAQGAFFDTPGDLQRLADKVNDALTAKFGLRNAMRAG